MKRQYSLVKLPVTALLGLAAGLALLVAAGLTVQPAAAETTTANTLKVSPVRSDIQVQPGEGHTVKVIVTNLTDDDISVSPIQNDFVAGDEDGTPALILDEDEYAPTHSLKRFMKPLVKEVTIPGNDSKTINVVINVPETAQPGGYFGAVRFAPTSPDDGGQVNLSPSVASLILLTVPGEATEKLTLSNFDVQQNGSNGWFFTNSDNLTTLVRFTSESDVQLGPIGKISVKQGDNVVYEADFNDKNPRDVILPDSARRWSVPINDIGNFGYFTAVATFTYGQSNQTVEVTKSFWVVPLWAMITGIVLLLALLVGLPLAIWRYVRGRNRRLLSNNKAKLRRR